MIASLGVIIAMLFGGILADIIGLQYTLVIAGIIGILGIILFGLIKKEYLNLFTDINTILLVSKFFIILSYSNT